MPEPDPFRAWLADFERQVDAAVGRAAPPGTREARAAQSAFDRWWTGEQAPRLEDRPPLEPPLELDFERRLDALSKEKARLESQLAAQDKETARLREGAEASQRRAGEAEARAAQAAREAQGACERLEADRALHAQTCAALTESRSFLQKALGESQRAERLAREQTSLERDRALAAENEAAALRAKLSELEPALRAAREQLAGQAGALEELRRQASVFQERLVQAKERTDGDVAGLRQDLRLFLEEFRLLVNTVQRADNAQDKP